MTKPITAKILIVDDTTENITLLTEMLQLHHYQISAARNGERAIDIARHTHPDLILLDIMMPGIDGFETCRRLKSLDSTQSIPVIFISAKTDIDDLVMGFNVGGVDYIQKPFHKEEVYARVTNQLKIQQLNKKLAMSELNMHELLIEYRQQSDQLQQIVTLVLDGLLELNSSGEIQQANPAIKTLFGYNTRELHSIKLSQLLAEPFASRYNDLFAQNNHQRVDALPDEKKQEMIGKRQDGSEFPIEFSMMKIPSGEGIYLAIIHDITTYKNTEIKLKRLSYIDSLTSLENRRGFDEHYEQLWLKNQQSNSQLAFIMIDIDYFKQFNDTYGHQAGDDCLKQVAASLQKAIKRPGDIISRIGGEEFAVILPDTSEGGAIQVAEQLRKNIEALAITHSQSSYQIITISLGIAIGANGEKSPSSSMLYQMADEALYQAKQAGKNKYIVF